MDLFDIDELAEKIAPAIVAEHGRWPHILTIAVEAEDYLKEHGIDMQIGDFELLVDAIDQLTPTLTVTAS